MHVKQLDYLKVLYTNVKWYFLLDAWSSFCHWNEWEHPRVHKGWLPSTRTMNSKKLWLHVATDKNMNFITSSHPLQCGPFLSSLFGSRRLGSNKIHNTSEQNLKATYTIYNERENNEWRHSSSLTASVQLIAFSPSDPIKTSWLLKFLTKAIPCVCV